MRATSPLDQIQYLGDFVELPRPKHPIGTRLNLHGLDDDSKSYYFQKAMLEILRDTRKIVNKLQNEGFMKDMVGKKMLDYNKNQIRAKLDLMRTADIVEVAGHRPQGMHVTGSISNQCYLVNGQCHGGVEYEAYLLFCKNVDGRDLVYIHPYPVIREGNLKDLVIKPEPTAWVESIVVHVNECDADIISLEGHHGNIEYQLKRCASVEEAERLKQHLDVHLSQQPDKRATLKAVVALLTLL